MTVSIRLYDLALRGLRRLAPVAASGTGKLGRGLAGRERDRERFREWARDRREPGRPLVWFHAPSVGEGLQARAVLGALRKRRPELQTVYSYFSPSAEALAERLDVDVAGYLPWDLQGEVGPTLDALRPAMIVFTKTEVWPGLVEAAARRSIPVVLVAATLPENAGRLRWPARHFLRPAFGALDRVLAISDDDGGRFRRLGVPPDRIAVTGDPAMDSVVERIRRARPDAPHLRPFAAGDPDGPPRRTVVAGSTWSADEGVIVPALSRVRDRMHADGRRLRLIIAPHEPTREHLAPLESALAKAGWRSIRLGALTDGTSGPGSSGPPRPPADADAVVVDRVGVLAELYTAGDVAFVGGGFHGHGLHSVLEPAAAGVPMIYGPRHANSLAAGELAAIGGGRVASDVSSMTEAFEGWLLGAEADRHRRTAGEVARRYIEAHQGASAATAAALDPLIPASSLPPRSTNP